MKTTGGAETCRKHKRLKDVILYAFELSGTGAGSSDLVRLNRTRKFFAHNRLRFAKRTAQRRTSGREVNSCAVCQQSHVFPVIG